MMKVFPILLLATQICCSSAWRFFDMNIIRHEPSNHFICFFKFTWNLMFEEAEENVIYAAPHMDIEVNQNLFSAC